jgi:hypothetical protein
MQRGSRTDLSRKNEADVENRVREYDSRLSLRFSENQGHYYITRSIERSKWDDTDPETKEMLLAKGSVYAEALANKEVVACTPIEIWMMESKDVVLRNVLKHLEMNDMKRFGVNSQDRVRFIENENSNHWDDFEATNKQKAGEEINAVGREFYRDNVAIKSSLIGIPTNSEISKFGR